MRAQTILEAIGHTPLVRLSRIVDGNHAEIWAKAEFLNPSGSLKDRIALRMIEGAEADGRLRSGGAIVEASTGNTGIALALVGAVKGYRVRIYMPDTLAQSERAKLMTAYGAEIVAVDVHREAAARDPSMHGGMVEVVPRILCREAERASPGTWWARQFSNPDNVLAHRDGTGGEIVEQLPGPAAAFTASVGTGGTLLGIGLALRARWPQTRVVAVEPAGDTLLGRSDYPLIEGITDGILLDLRAQGMAAHLQLIKDEDAINMAHRLAEEEGLACGVSGGANVLAALAVARQLAPGNRVVTVLPDSRDRYLATERYIT